MKGVPVRIEIGPKDVDKEQCVLVRRDTGEKQFVALKDVQKTLDKLWKDIQEALLHKAKEHLDQSVVKTDSFDELLKAIKKGKIVYAPFFDDVANEDAIKEKTNGANTRCLPLAQHNKPMKCVYSGKETKEYAYFGRNY